MATEHDDELDGPFDFTGMSDHLARLREACQHFDDQGHLVAWTDEEIAARVRACGVPMTRGYVQQLSDGSADNPTATKLVGLANAFDVSPTYFFSAAVRRRTNRRLDARLDELRARRLRATDESKQDDDPEQHS